MGRQVDMIRLDSVGRIDAEERLFMSHWVGAAANSVVLRFPAFVGMSPPPPPALQLTSRHQHAVLDVLVELGELLQAAVLAAVAAVVVEPLRQRLGHGPVLHELGGALTAAPRLPVRPPRGTGRADAASSVAQEHGGAVDGVEARCLRVSPPPPAVSGWLEQVQAVVLHNESWACER